MPSYLNPDGKKNPSKGVYPGSNALVVGYPAIPFSDPSLAADQFETVSSGYTSIPASIAAAFGMRGYTQRQIMWQVLYGNAPAGITWTLQGAIEDVDSEYQTVDTYTGTTNSTRTVTGDNNRFYRVTASGVSQGGSPPGPCTATVKITSM